MNLNIIHGKTQTILEQNIRPSFLLDITDYLRVILSQSAHPKTLTYLMLTLHRHNSTQKNNLSGIITGKLIFFPIPTKP